MLLNRRGVKGNNWEEMLIMIWSYSRKTLYQVNNHLSELDLKFIGVDIYPNARANKVIAVDFLESLTFCLHEKYQKKVIVRIDECDAPLNHAFCERFYEEASEIFCIL
jgi:hypothetical protein